MLQIAFSRVIFFGLFFFLLSLWNEPHLYFRSKKFAPLPSAMTCTAAALLHGFLLAGSFSKHLNQNQFF